VRSKSDERSRRARYAGRAQAWLLGVAVAFATLFLGARAEAQVSVLNPTINRAVPDGGATQLPARTSNGATQYYLSYQDCIDNVTLTFTLSVPTSSQSSFQVWATTSADCTQETNRELNVSEGTTSTCVSLANSYPPNGTFSITAQELITKVFGTEIVNCVDTTGEFFSTSGNTGPQPVNIYFLTNVTTDPVPSGDFYEWTDAPGTPATQVDLLGPIAPSPVSVGALEQGLALNIPLSTDSDLLGYFVFCYPGVSTDGGVFGMGGFGGAATLPMTTSTTSTTTTGTGGTAAGTDAGADAGTTSGAGGSGGTGGTSGSGGASTVCADPNKGIPFLSGNHPNPNDPRVQPYICGTMISPTSTTPTISGLVDGQEYVIAIAGYDEVNNMGPLSVFQCATPEPTSTFFNEYCADGGKGCGGCGSCAVGADNDLTWTVLACSTVAAVAFGLRRARGRRGARNNSVNG
jgi:hypothetical protein